MLTYVAALSLMTLCYVVVSLQDGIDPAMDTIYVGGLPVDVPMEAQDVRTRFRHSCQADACIALVQCNNRITAVLHNHVHVFVCIPMSTVAVNLIRPPQCTAESGRPLARNLCLLPCLHGA